MKNKSRMAALFISATMLTTLTACSSDNQYINFLKYGWSGNETAASETVVEAPVDDAIVVDDIASQTPQAAAGTTKAATDKSTKKTTAGKTTAGKTAATKSTTGKTAASVSGNANKTPAAAASSSNAAATQAASTQKTYTAAEALALYKTSANAIKTGSGITCSRDKEIITKISGEIPSMYQSFGFKEGTKTDAKVCSDPSSIKDDFCVEGKTYVCNLSASDIKSASVSYSGTDRIVTIVVKDDSEGTYDRSSKCVSTISAPIGTWTCKNVTLKGTINAAGQMTHLYYSMPTHGTFAGNSFAFNLEQFWTITY